MFNILKNLDKPPILVGFFLIFLLFNEPVLYTRRFIWIFGQMTEIKPVTRQPVASIELPHLLLTIFEQVFHNN